MRTITTHQLNTANSTLNIRVTDEPGAGGACHRYIIGGYNAFNNPSLTTDDDDKPTVLLFQNGPISAEAGVNGITHEALLAVLIDRLEGFQKGAFANAYNAEALTYLCDARAVLSHRTQERVARGVEGTYEV